MRVDVVELTDEAAILPLLERDRRWAVFALTDLDAPHREHARYIGAVADGVTKAIVLVYAPPGLSVLSPCGDEAGVREIMRRARDLPSAAFMLAQADHVAAIRERYEIDEVWPMLRMVVTADELKPAPAVDAEIIRLGHADLTALQNLYALWLATGFRASNLDDGVYFGAYAAGKLVSAAGTHAVSVRHGVGVIGSVFTHPEHRGRGLATATTGGVARELMRMGVREVALNVREDNGPAITAYRRLGFGVHEVFREGHGRLR